MATTPAALATAGIGAAAAKPVGTSASSPDAATQAVLDQLHPLLLPAPPPWTPQTPGWAVLAVLVLLLLAWAAWRGWRRWHANRHRRLALAELRRLRSALHAPATTAAQRVAAARRLPELVRRLALAHAPRVARRPGREGLPRRAPHHARPERRRAAAVGHHEHRRARLVRRPRRRHARRAAADHQHVRPQLAHGCATLPSERSAAIVSASARACLSPMAGSRDRCRARRRSVSRSKMTVTAEMP